MLAIPMDEARDILISLKPQHADNLFHGKKTVELRRRRLKIAEGTRVWIYATAPTAAICGYANLVRIASGSPTQIWRSLGNQTAISREEFEEYFHARDVAYGLVLDDVMAMQPTLSLEGIRKAVNDFHPPQFYCHLNGAMKSMRLSSRKYEAVRRQR
jgi:predicted transcriptional regulator